MNLKKVYKAAKRGDLEAVKRYFGRENFADDVKKEIARIAAGKNDLTLLRFVLDENPSIARKEVESVFRRAVASGYLNTVKYLVEEHNVDILYRRSTDDDTPTAVHLAIQKGHFDILKYFLEDRKLDVDTPLDDKGWTVLFVATHHNAGEDILKYLVEKKNANLTIVDSDSEHILYEAASQNDLHFIKYVLDERKAEIDINWRNKHGKTLLKQVVCYYSKSDPYATLEYLVGQKHAEVDIPDEKKRTPLHCVRSEKMCAYLIQHGANINQRGGQNDETPLHRAIRYANADKLGFPIVQYLIEHGADVNLTNKDGVTPLNYATTSYGQFQLKICELLVQCGADVNQGNDFGNTPLHFTIMGKTSSLPPSNGDEPNNELFRYFIKCGADVNRVNEAGESPLHWAIIHNRIDLDKELIEHGANINQRNNKGETPVYTAVDHNCMEILDFLVGEKHADVNAARYGDKMTPLHRAASHNSYELCQCLVENGAKVLVQDEDGKTPIERASEKRVIEYLKKMSATRNRRSIAFSSPSSSFLPFSASTLYADKLDRISTNVSSSVNHSIGGASSTSISDIEHVPHIQGFLGLVSAFVGRSKTIVSSRTMNALDRRTTSFVEDVVNNLEIEMKI